MGNRAGSTPAPGTKTASKEAVFLVLGGFCFRVAKHCQIVFSKINSNEEYWFGFLCVVLIGV